MTRPDLHDEFDEDDLDEFGGDEDRQPPWHNSTRAVVGASAAGVAVIGVLVAAVMYMTGREEPAAPVDFVDPSFTATASRTSTTATTETITSTAPLSTTEINGPPAPSTTTGSSDTSTSSSESSSNPSTPYTRPRQRETDERPGDPTSRRPRFNVTRTLAPQQAG